MDVKPRIAPVKGPPQRNTATANTNATLRMFQLANSGRNLQPPIVPLNLNRMMIAPVQVVKAEQMVQNIIKTHFIIVING